MRRRRYEAAEVYIMTSLSDDFHPHPQQIESLIAKANNHPLGIAFLLEGDLCAVAITFGVSVFAVDAARDNLRKFKETKEE
jgi:hypothetical protein